MLTFRDPENPARPLEAGEEPPYAEAKYEPAAAALSLAKFHLAADSEEPAPPLTDASFSRLPGGPPGDTLSSGSLTGGGGGGGGQAKRRSLYKKSSSVLLQAGPTAVAEGLQVVVLTCSSESHKEILVKGFQVAKEYSHHHSADLHPNAGGGGNTARGKHALALNTKSASGNALAHLHHLYRPHHHHNHPPARFHDGIEAEVTYDAAFEVSVEHEGKANLLKMPCRVFDEHMYLRGKIVSYDRETETYDLVYCDGPYMPHEEPDGHVAFKMPALPDAHFYIRGVPSHCITVDMSDNYGECNGRANDEIKNGTSIVSHIPSSLFYHFRVFSFLRMFLTPPSGSHFPLFLILASIVQVFCFVYYVYAVWGDKNGEGVQSDAPIAGPEVWWMKIISPFDDQCQDLRPEVWRLWSYQLVHAGYQHIIGNIFMQVKPSRTFFIGFLSDSRRAQKGHLLCLFFKLLS
jgi:hypothetical protein